MEGRPATARTSGRTCPSGRCEVGAVLLGIVSVDGSVAYLTPGVPVDQAFVDRAAQGRTPEARFRFAQQCAEDRCVHWAGDRCSVIDAAVSSPQLRPDTQPALPRCGIRASCRWFAQRGVAACGVYPVVVRDPDG